MTAINCKNVGNLMLEAYRLLAYKQVNPEEVAKWIKLGEKNLMLLRLLLRKNATSVAEKKKKLSPLLVYSKVCKTD